MTGNYFRDDLTPRAGRPWPTIPTSTTFDRNNDLFLTERGTIEPRHEWQGPVVRVADHPSVIAACHVALKAYDRATLARGAFIDLYGDDDAKLERIAARLDADIAAAKGDAARIADLTRRADRAMWAAMQS